MPPSTRGLHEVVAVDGGGHGGGVAAGLHEVEHDSLAEDVLEGYAVGSECELALALCEVLSCGVVEVAEEELVGEGQGPVSSLRRTASRFRAVAA